MDIDLYNFADHLDSIIWIEELPKGLVLPTVDLRYQTVNITKQKSGYDIYIGPKDDQSGGDGILIRLNNQFHLIDYEIERLAPLP